MDLERLFVYGTLREGERLHRFIEPYIVRTSYDDKFKDISMFTKPHMGYPVCVWKMGSSIIGDTLTVKSECLDITDDIELSAGYKRCYLNYVNIYLYDEPVYGFLPVQDGDWKGYSNR